VSRYQAFVVVLAAAAIGIAALLGGAAPADPPREVTLILGAYTVPKEAYQKEIIPKFQAYWKKKTGQTVRFSESYVASGEQARAIIAGFEADVAALSLKGDTDKLADVKLITYDWTKTKYDGMVTESIVVIGVRRGNPKKIKDWQDLTKSNVDVLIPNPKTSGGAMWDVLGVYGAGLAYNKNNKKKAEELLLGVRKRVKVLDKSGRASVTTFENKVGDAIITYENEMLLRLMNGRDYVIVIPKATMRIQNPIAVVDKNAKKHGVYEVAKAFVDFCLTPEAQRGFAKYGLRPVDPKILKEFSKKYPKPQILFDASKFGGWDKINKDIFGPGGLWDRVNERALGR
jgi:sulfate/thiosulfate-binding protein